MKNFSIISDNDNEPEEEKSNKKLVEDYLDSNITPKKTRKSQIYIDNGGYHNIEEVFVEILDNITMDIELTQNLPLRSLKSLTEFSKVIHSEIMMLENHDVNRTIKELLKEVKNEGELDEGIGDKSRQVSSLISECQRRINLLTNLSMDLKLETKILDALEVETSSLIQNEQNKTSEHEMIKNLKADKEKIYTFIRKEVLIIKDDLKSEIMLRSYFNFPLYAIIIVSAFIFLLFLYKGDFLYN